MPALATSRAWGEQQKDLNLLTLYESRIQRIIDKNYALLEKLQQQRREAHRLFPQPPSPTPAFPPY